MAKYRYRRRRTYTKNLLSFIPNERMDPPTSGTEELQQHKNMADDDEAPPPAVKAEKGGAADARVKNEEESTPPVTNPPVSVVKIKDLEVGRNADHGPTFKDQFNHAHVLSPSAAAARAGGLLLDGVSISDVSESAVHISSNNNNKHQNHHHDDDEFQPGGAAPSLFQQPNEEPTEIPFVDNVAVQIPETQIRNEQQFVDLEHRLAQAENELRVKHMNKKRITCCIVAGVITLLGLLLSIVFGIVPISTRYTSPTASLTATTATAAPTVMETPAYAAARAELIANLINDVSLLAKAIPYPPSTTAATPQPDEQALEWLIRDDLQVIDIANDGDLLTLDETYKVKLVQRFVLATFVFHLDTAGLLRAAALRRGKAWLGASDECSWVGIICTDDFYLDKIILDGVGFQGSLPINIGLLSSSLILLNLRNNVISGSLPSTLTLLTSLQHLSLRENDLTGDIPNGLNKLSNLVSLDVSDNSLRGTDLFVSLLSMTNLETFAAERNLFYNTIPSSIGALTNLATFAIPYNSVYGVIPSEITFLTKLTVLSMGDTQLSGSLPSDLSKLTNLETLSFASSRFSGTVPSLANCTQLGLLNLQLNEFQGRLPALPASVNITTFDRNRFTGPLPINFPLLTNLNIFTATNNELTGTLPELAAATNLVTLHLSTNNLTGTVPDIQTLTNLDSLLLDDNKFTGTIPELSTLTALEVLNLSFNRFNGTIPDLSSLSALTKLVLQVNALTGTIPLANRPSWSSIITYANFGDNLLTGPLPLLLSNFPAMTELFFQGNKLTRTLPTSYELLTNLNRLDFSNNRLSGPIPPGYSTLTNLQELGLERNMFTGTIPSVLSAMTGLTYLGLHLNLLAGSLPSELGVLTNLATFNVRNNTLTGTIPTEYLRWSSIKAAYFQNTLINGSMPFCNSPRIPDELGADCGEVDCPCCVSRICCPLNSSCLDA
jgi:Leucine-rich repeat (LRR) protein